MRLIGYVCIFLSVLCASCINTRLNGAAVSKTPSRLERSDQMNEKRREEVIHIKTVLSKTDLSSWKVAEARPIGRESLLSVFFFDLEYELILGIGFP